MRRNALPTIVRIERIWQRADYKRWRAKDGHVPLPRQSGRAGLQHTGPTTGHSGGRPPAPPASRRQRPPRPWHTTPSEPEP
ncbi:hypothetical protein [Nonomuraea sp. NPDC049400]|uniref:hypothetical protein n=1 Tax=Nonomuraea sp. NPDC049400 TaxID=3364352 RepID=UPI003792F994